MKLNKIIEYLKNTFSKIENMFLLIAIPIGLLYLTFMIPGQVPDDRAHFTKAYDVSLGHFTTHIDENGDSYVEVPKSLSEFHHTKLINREQLKELMSQKTDYNDTEKVISNAQNNYGILYIFSGFAFFVSRLLNINIAYGIILGRLLNFAFFLVAGYFAIKKIPFGKLVLAIYMLMPMNMQQVTSISADAFINSVLLYFIAYSIYIIFKKEELTKYEIAIYILLASFSGILKMVYVLVSGIGFLIVKRKDINIKKKVFIIIVALILGGIFAVGSYIHSGSYTLVPESTREYNEKLDVDSSRQISLIKENPKVAIGAFVNDWTKMQKQYVFTCIGSNLGCLDIQVPETVIILYLILLIISVYSEKNEFEFKLLEKIWLILIVIGVIVLIEFAMYTGFTPVGADFIGGIQGRYFIPVYILLLLCLSKKDNYIDFKNVNQKFMLISGVLNLLVIMQIINFFK